MQCDHGTRMSEASSEPPPRRPRADAARNRERLLAAAKTVFSAGGPTRAWRRWRARRASASARCTGISRRARPCSRRSIGAKSTSSRRWRRVWRERAARRGVARLGQGQCRVRRHQEGHGGGAGARRAQEGSRRLFLREAHAGGGACCSTAPARAGALKAEIDAARTVARAVRLLHGARPAPVGRASALRLIDVFFDGLLA